MYTQTFSRSQQFRRKVSEIIVLFFHKFKMISLLNALFWWIKFSTFFLQYLFIVTNSQTNFNLSVAYYSDSVGNIEDICSYQCNMFLISWMNINNLFSLVAVATSGNIIFLWSHVNYETLTVAWTNYLFHLWFLLKWISPLLKSYRFPLNVPLF